MESIVTADVVVMKLMNWLEKNNYLKVPATNALAEKFIGEELV